jgi:hypothetical protein
VLEVEGMVFRNADFLPAQQVGRKKQRFVKPVLL